MKNYRDSDYAVNKFSEGIVYRFDGETEYTARVEHLDRFELNSLTAKTEQSNRRD